MTILPLPSNVPVLVIDNFYSEVELNLIWKEISFLTDKNKLKSPKDTMAAECDEEYLKNAHGVWVDNIYADRDVSNILQCNRKLFSENFISLAVDINPLYCILKDINFDNTLLNYYENGDEYKQHKDNSIFTAVTILFQEPCKFSGGDFVIHDFDMLTEKKNNRVILFPGVLQHSVTPVKMIGEYEPFSGHGRYTITQFMNIKY
jgi:Rps23 Pro-64 3,4-dihydroxylase Tpa1-like proline 4-hydroxylase